MNLKFLLSNFDFKREVAVQGRNLLKHRKYLRAIFYAILWVVLSCGKVLFGQTAYTTAILIQPLDNTGGAARALAMGSAFVGVADDASALLWNPAGLGNLQNAEISLYHNFWLVGTLQESLIAAIPVGGMGGLGAMVTYLDYGNFQGSDSFGSLTSPYTANKYGLTLGWGRELAKGFSIGLAAQGNIQSALNQSFSVFSGSAGILFAPDAHFRAGASVINFGDRQDWALVPTTIEAGLSYQVDLGRPHSFLVALSGISEPEGVDRAQIGGEYSFQSRYFLRAGYQYRFQNTLLQGLQGFTAGAGIRFADFQLDYAYLPYGDLGTSNQISLSYLFPTNKVNPVAAKPALSPGGELPPASFKPENGTQGSRNVLTLQFDIPSDLVAQGKAMDSQGRTVEAMRLYEQELIVNKQDAAAWYDLGADYYKFKQKAYAIQCFEQVLKIIPNNKSLSDWLEQYKSQP